MISDKRLAAAVLGLVGLVAWSAYLVLIDARLMHEVDGGASPTA